MCSGGSKQRWRAERREAANGQEALEQVARLRQDPETMDLPVVVVTAKDLTKQDRARLNGHVDQAMQKRGFRREELLDEVRRSVARAVGDGA